MFAAKSETYPDLIIMGHAKTSIRSIEKKSKRTAADILDLRHFKQIIARSK